jgi:putative DNA-invertase from lambdoid prophage Rac
MTAAIYARVSTADQDCSMQLTELREHAARNGWEIAGEYIDTGISGTKRSRPALDRLMKAAGKGTFDAVLVWKLDRFGRSLGDLIENIRTLTAAKVRFIATTQNIDTDNRSPIGRFMLHIFGAFAEFERDLIVERVKAGIAEAKRQGKHCGRPKKIFRRDRAEELRAAGQSWRQISAELGIPAATIRLALSPGAGACAESLPNPRQLSR